MTRTAACSRYFGLAGRQLHLLDTDTLCPVPSTSTAGEEASDLAAAADRLGRAEVEVGEANEPLLLSMSHPRSAFIAALSLFERRVAVANVTNEVLVPWRSAALAADDEEPPPTSAAAGGARHSNIVQTTVLPAAVSPLGLSWPSAAATGEAREDDASAYACSAAERADESWRREVMLHGLSSAGEWTRVDVDFGRLSALGCAHWLVAGVSLPAGYGAEEEGELERSGRAASEGPQGTLSQRGLVQQHQSWRSQIRAAATRKLGGF